MESSFHSKISILHKPWLTSVIFPCLVQLKTLDLPILLILCFVAGCQPESDNLTFAEHTRLGVWTLDGDPSHVNLLRFALKESNFTDTAIVFTVSMTAPLEHHGSPTELGLPAAGPHRQALAFR